MLIVTKKLIEAVFRRAGRMFYEEEKDQSLDVAIGFVSLMGIDTTLVVSFRHDRDVIAEVEAGDRDNDIRDLVREINHH